MRNRFIALLIGITLAFASAAPIIHAQGTGLGGQPAATTAGADANGAIELKNPLPTTSVPGLIGTVLNAFLGILGTSAFVMFVYGGFLWLISGGSADRIKKGKNVMVWAVLGLVLVFSSAALVRFVLKAFGAGG